MIENLKLRQEEQGDYFENENVVREAFWNVYKPGCDEHLLLHKLRTRNSYIKELSLVACLDNKIIGNIIYSKIFQKDNMSNEIICFGPISVLPEYQRKGVGTLLINKSIEKAIELGYKAIIICGDLNYYKRFGFIPAYNYKVYLEGKKMEEKLDFFLCKELEEGYFNKNCGFYNFDKAFFDLPANEVDEYDKKFPKKIKREKRDTDHI